MNIINTNTRKEQGLSFRPWFCYRNRDRGGILRAIRVEPFAPLRFALRALGPSIFTALRRRGQDVGTPSR